MTSRRQQLRITRLRGVAGLLAVAVVAGQLAGFAHRAEVAHASCDDHGELVDVGLLASAPGERHPATRASVDGAEDQRSHGHDHCQLAPAQRERVAPSLEPTWSGAPPPAITTLALAPLVATPAPLSPLLVAPKTSPPAEI